MFLVGYAIEIYVFYNTIPLLSMFFHVVRENELTKRMPDIPAMPGIHCLKFDE